MKKQTSQPEGKAESIEQLARKFRRLLEPISTTMLARLAADENTVNRTLKSSG